MIVNIRSAQPISLLFHNLKIERDRIDFLDSLHKKSCYYIEKKYGCATYGRGKVRPIKTFTSQRWRYVLNLLFLHLMFTIQ